MRRLCSRHFSAATDRKHHRDIDTLIRGCASAKDLEKFIGEQSIPFNAKNCALAFRTLSKLGSQSITSLHTLLAFSQPISFSPKEFSLSLHSIASSRLVSQAPPELVSKLTVNTISTFNAQDTANTLWAFAKLNPAFPPKLILPLFAHKFDQPEFLQSFTVQGLVTSLWAFAKMEFRQDLNLETISHELLKRNIAEFSPQDLSNMTWSFAVLGYYPYSLFQQVAQEVNFRAATLTGFSFQSLVNLLWSFAALHVKDKTLCYSVVRELNSNHRQFSRMNAQDLATILYSLGKLNFLDLALCAKIERELQSRNLFEFTPQELANSLWGFANLAYQPQPCLCDAIGKEVQTRKRFAIKDYASILHSFALLNYTSNPACVDYICQSLQSSLESMNSQDVANTLYALASLGMLDRPSAVDIFQHAKWDISERNREHAMQLHQTRLAWNLVHPLEPSALLKKLGEEWVSHLLLQDNGVKSSKIHKEVALHLTRILPKHVDVKEEVVLLGGLVVDVFIPSQNLVVEVDGPYHYFVNRTQEPTGASKLKVTLLRGYGYQVKTLHVTVGSLDEQLEDLLLERKQEDTDVLKYE